MASYIAASARLIRSKAVALSFGKIESLVHNRKLVRRFQHLTFDRLGLFQGIIDPRELLLSSDFLLEVTVHTPLRKAASVMICMA